MPTLFERLSDVQREQRSQLFGKLHDYGSLYFGVKDGGMFEDKLYKSDQDAWRRRHDLIWMEAAASWQLLVPLTTQAERLESRGEWSRSDVSSFDKAVINFDKWPEEERAALAKVAAEEDYQHESWSDRMRSERASKMMNIMERAQQELLEREVESIVKFLQSKKVGTSHLYRQLRDGKHRG